MAELLYYKADRIVTLTLNRPERFNAISHAMLDAPAQRLTETDADSCGRSLR